MKPAKKTKKVRLISKARAKETRLRLSLHDQAAKAERALYDAQAVAEAARQFWEQSQKAFKASAGVSAKERAEAVLDATRTFWEQSTDAVSAAQVALEKARDELFADNDKRIAQDVEASPADLDFLNRWAKNYRLITAVRRGEPKGHGKVISSLLIPKKGVKKK